jgi:hypothetical protein
LGRSAHLVKRFFGSLRPGGPPRAEVVWVAQVLSPAEYDLWCRMNGPDRRHSVQVARTVERSLGSEATPPVLAAALLHDVGKLDSRLRTYGRAVATISGAVAGADAAADWARTKGFTRRVGLYLQHPDLGGDRLGMVGSDPFTEAWAREHHLPEEEWTVDPHLGRALKAADND